MRYFPIFVDLKHRRVIVVGGAEEAARKVRLLLKTEARIAVIALALNHELAAEPRVEWLAKDFAPELLDGAALVYSADLALNASVSEAAQARGIPVNAVDDAAISTFIIPSIVDRDPVVVAIGTEGTAPVLGQGLRAKIDALLPQTLGPLATKAARLRMRVAEMVPHGKRRRAFWQEFFFGAPREALESGDAVAFELALNDAIYGEARPAIGRVSLVGIGAGDPELLTLKAHRRIQEADVIVHDAGVSAGVLEMARRDALRIAIGAANDASEVLVAKASKGLHVVRLVAGDGRTSEGVAVAAAGLAVDVVPGVGATSAKVTRIRRKKTHVVAFPVREDIREAVLKAAS